MALLLPRRHQDAHVLETRKVTQTEVYGQSVQSSPNESRDSKGCPSPNQDEKSNISVQHETRSKEPVKNVVPTIQSPITLSWLPDFEWTDEDELALNKFENDAGTLPDLPESEVGTLYGNPPGTGVSSTDTANTSKDQKARDRLESRKKLEALLSASLKNAGGGALRKPRWRLDAEADSDDVSNFDTEDSEAMEPLQVFRSAVLTVLHTIYLKKMLMEKRLAEKESATRDFESMLRVYFDATRLWFGKVVRTPMLSLLQDSSLDIDISTKSSLAGSTLRGFAKKFGGILARRPHPSPPQALASSQPSSESSVDPVKLLKLKVRMKGILQALSKAIDKKEVPSGILAFWKRLSTDGVYFPPSYQLFYEERLSLEFDALGATRRMDFEESILADVKENDGSDEAAKGFSRFNIVMVNFLFARILIPHVILQPWSVGIGTKNIGKQTSANLANLATLFYCVCRQLSPLPPPVERPEASFLGRRRSKVLEISQPNTSDESPVHSSEINPATIPSERQEEHVADISFLSIDEIGRRLISDRTFPCNDAQVTIAVTEHHLALHETMVRLRSQLHGFQENNTIQ
ncbi:hypothetical protein V7S43_008183 [Phytophthora oleae]|uniref:Uncharacterized protein n=1 Tax=Phytophthora oleae TaxID=2107226 RepID=A0ABD3FJR1_9STRA